MSDTELHFKFRGFADVWDRERHAGALWMGNSCMLSPDAIEVSAPGRTHVHAKTGLIELRWMRWPFPGFVAVSRSGGMAIYSVFQALWWSRLRSAMACCGYRFTEELPYYSRRRVLEDIWRYELRWR